MQHGVKKTNSNFKREMSRGDFGLSGRVTNMSFNPNLYSVEDGSYEASWSHSPSAPTYLNFYPDQLYGQTSITVTSTFPYYGNTSNQVYLDTPGVTRFNLQIDLNTSTLSLIYQNGSDSSDELRIRCLSFPPNTIPEGGSPSGLVNYYTAPWTSTNTNNPARYYKQFPKAQGMPIFPVSFINIKTGLQIFGSIQEPLHQHYTTYANNIGFYAQLLDDGTFALLYEVIILELPTSGQPPQPLNTQLYALSIGTLNDFLSALGFWSDPTLSSGISINISGIYN